MMTRVEALWANQTTRTKKKKKRDKKLESMEGIVLAKRGLGRKRITWRKDTRNWDGRSARVGIWAYWVLGDGGGRAVNNRMGWDDKPDRILRRGALGAIVSSKSQLGLARWLRSEK
jgi:hypothetical protein